VDVGPSQPRRVLLDACCVLNLFASGQVDAILASLPFRIGIAERAATEALYLRRGGEGDDADERIAIDLQPLVEGGVVEILTVDTEAEIATYVTLATQLDDGEAMTCALALHRDCAVATDDRKAIRLLVSLTPPIEVLTTSILLKMWADTPGVADAVVRQALLDIRERARFLPGRHDSLKSWWDTITSLAN
jgi:hypothetical protein